jgi:hypothetical protein
MKMLAKTIATAILVAVTTASAASQKYSDGRLAYLVENGILMPSGFHELLLVF